MHNCFYFLCCIGAFFLSFETVNAQRIFSGTVKDAETIMPLVAANVVMQDGEKTVDFTITDTKGEFTIASKYASDSLRLIVSSLGYTPYTVLVGKNNVFHIKLTPSPIQLKEVTIRPGRIWGRNDTIRFDASQFLQANDKTVEDLMKRLPGIDVNDHGNIQYNGKPIGTMYVEGLDMMGSRYKAISKNLSAKSIKGVEVLDNHQRIKSLVGKMPSDVPDINLKLKNSFKDKWNWNGKLSSGFSPQLFLYESEASAMQIAKRSQSFYSVKMSNTGNGITKEADEGFTTLLTMPDYRLLYVNALSAPLKEPRWLFDKAALATANRLYKTGVDSRLKLNACYTRDDACQEKNETSTFFNPKDTIAIEENKVLRLVKDVFNISADYEDNASSHFLRNKLDLRLTKEKETTAISGSYNLSQHVENKSFSLRDNVSFIRRLTHGNVFSAQAVMGYWLNHQSLRFEDYDNPYDFHGFYAKAIGEFAISRTKVAQTYSISTVLNFNNLKTHHRAVIKPAYEYLFGPFRLNWVFPVELTYFPYGGRTLWLPEAYVRLNYKINYAWKVYASAKYTKELDDITMLYDSPYIANYRTRIENKVDMPLSEKQLYQLHVEYKNTLRAFFFTSDVFYMHSHANHTVGQDVKNGIFRFTHYDKSHSESSTNIKGTFSKGLFDLHAKLSLDVSWSENRAEQIRNKALIRFSFQNIMLAPKFSISPTSETELSYQAKIHGAKSSFGEEKGKNLWNMHHKISLGYTKKHVEMSLTGEYFRNEITGNRKVELFYTDLTAGYKFKKVSLMLSLKNLFNQTSYQYTLYNPLSVYSSQLSLRPRELLISARFKF